MSNIPHSHQFRGDRVLRLAFGLIILFLLTFGLFAGSACSSSDKMETVVLDLLPSPAISLSSNQTDGFDEKNSQVLRCVSLTEKEDHLTAIVTKAKSAEISSLVFVNLAESGDPESSFVEIALVDLETSEGDYEIDKAVYRTVTLSSVTDAISKNGIPYSDWLTGTMSQDDLFPCCR